MLLYRIFFVIFIFYPLGCDQTAEQPFFVRSIEDQKQTPQDGNLHIPGWGWAVPTGFIAGFLLFGVFSKQSPSPSTDPQIDPPNIPNRTYYGIPKKGFPMQYDNAFPGVLKDRFDWLGTRADGSCWARAFLIILLDRVAVDAEFFNRVIEKLQSDPSFWGPIAETDHTVEIAPIIQLLRELQPLSEKERFNRINHAATDRMLIHWIRHIVSRDHLKTGSQYWNEDLKIYELRWRTILQPSEFGAEEEYQALSAYFDMTFHWLWDNFNHGSVWHTLFSPGHHIMHIQGPNRIQEDLPLWDSANSKMVIVRVNTNHAEILRRKTDAAPFAPEPAPDIFSSLVQGTALSRDHMLRLLKHPAFDAHLTAREQWETAKLPPQIESYCDVPIVILSQLATWDQNPITDLIHRVEHSRSFGEAFTEKNPIELLLWFLNKLKSASSKEEKEYIISRRINEDIILAFTEHLAIHYGIKVQGDAHSYLNAAWALLDGRKYMEAWERFTVAVLPKAD